MQPHGSWLQSDHFLSPCSALEALINFAYSGHVAIDQQNVQSLLIGSSFLQLQNVKDACCSFLQERSVRRHRTRSVRSDSSAAGRQAAQSSEWIHKAEASSFQVRIVLGELCFELGEIDAFT